MLFEDLFLFRAPLGEPILASLAGLALSLGLVTGVLVLVERTPLLKLGSATRLGGDESLMILLSSSIALNTFSESASMLLGVAIAEVLTGLGVVEAPYLPPAV